MTEERRSHASVAAIYEPLEISAPIARNAADRLCGRDPLSARTCAWYHGFWQYVRLLGLGASPSVHAGHLLPTLRALARTGDNERLLISGSADYSMLAHIISAYGAERAAVRPVVVDICETPLYMCRWYAERLSVAIETARSDICSFEPNERFDVIFTHAFLGYFPPSERGRLLRKWAALLRPGGRLVTIQRIRPGADGEVVRFTPRQKEAFVAKFNAAAPGSGRLLDVSPAWLAAAAREYADRFWAYPVRSTQELARLLEGAALTVEMLEVSAPRDQEVDQQENAFVSGPTIPTTAEYAFVVASRPWAGHPTL